VGALLIAGIASAGIYFAADYLGVSVKILTRDPYRAAQVPPYYAYVSLLGSTIWLIAGVATLSVGLFAKRVLNARLSDESTYRIIVIGGATGVVMAVDDILLFHDAIADTVGIPELLFHGFYLLCFLFLIGAARGLLLQTPWILFFSALACFGVSSVIDEFTSSDGLVDESEDVFKIIAILFWAIYFSQVCWDYMGTKSAAVKAVKNDQLDANIVRSL
jgi:hypothetical protein